MANNMTVLNLMVSADLPSKSVGGMSTDVLKSILIIALLAITLMSSLIPFALRRAAISHESSTRRRHIYASVFSLLSCFGGGVFLATCLLDLFPDAIELIAEGLTQLGITSQFPLAEFFVAIGFFIVLFIEQIVLWFREKRNDEHDTSASSDSSDRHRIVRNEATSTEPERVGHRRHTVPPSQRIAEGPLATLGNTPIPDRRHRRQSKPKDPATVGVHKSEEKGEDHAPIVVVESVGHEDDSVSDSQSPQAQVPSVIIVNNVVITEEDLAHAVVNEATEDIESIRADIHFDPDSHSTFRAVMLVMALSTHATFEGLALGLQTDAATALQIFGALAIHKCVIGFSLGMRLVQSRLRTISIVGCCLLFCVSALVGGFLGIAITETVKSSSASMVNGSLQGLACGTFLYITAFEILPHELNESGHRLPKLIMLLLGFTFICLFVLFYPS